MASRDELIASEKAVEDVEAEIGADSLSYLSIDAITEALDRSPTDLCLGCVTGEYPYDVEGEATDRDVTRPSIDGETSVGD
jgi:amidophosphoribosyltransferase